MRSTTTAASSRSARCFGKSLPAARRADLVAGPADALEARWPPRRATRPGSTRSTAPMSMPSSRLRGGDEALEPARLELVLDLEPPLARQRAVVGLHQLLLHRRGALRLGGAVLALPVQLVEAGGQALGQAAGVDEDERGAVLLDQLEQAGVHRRPDRAAHRAGRGRAATSARRSTVPSSAMSSTGTTTSISSGLRTPASTMVTGPGPALAVVAGVGAAEEAGDLLERALGGRQPDALRRRAAAAAHPVVEPLERERRGGCRAWWRPARGSRRRSPPRRRAASPGPPR